MADLSITNPTQHSFKDITIKCTHAGASGTVIDSSTRTIYEFVPAKSTRKFRNFNMGFIHAQASKSHCEITDLKLADQAEEMMLQAQAHAQREKAKAAAEASSNRARLAQEQAQLKAKRDRELSAQISRSQQESERNTARLVEQCKKYRGKSQWEAPTSCQPVMYLVNKGCALGVGSMPAVCN